MEAHTLENCKTLTKTVATKVRSRNFAAGPAALGGVAFDPMRLRVAACGVPLTSATPAAGAPGAAKNLATVVNASDLQRVNEHKSKQ